MLRIVLTALHIKVAVAVIAVVASFEHVEYAQTMILIELEWQSIFFDRVFTFPTICVLFFIAYVVE